MGSYKNQAGSIMVILAIIFLAVVAGAGFFVYKTITKSTQKVSQSSQSLTVALKEEYSNPFSKDTNYSNPFSSYQNPFDNLKQ